MTLCYAVSPVLEASFCGLPSLRTGDYDIFLQKISVAEPNLVPDNIKDPDKPDLLYWSGRQDSNLRPHGPKPRALPDCATPRHGANLYSGRQR